MHDKCTYTSIYGSGAKELIISNEEMEDLMKIVKQLEESELLVKGVSETIKNERKEQKGGFLPILLGTLADSLLGSALTGKGVIRAGENFLCGPILSLILNYKYYQN